MKLLVDPPIYADRHYTLDIAGPRAECEPVQSVDGALSLIHLRGSEIFLLLGKGQIRGDSESQQQDYEADLDAS
jgi:hypothetical protein